MHVVVRVTHRNDVPVSVVPELHMGANGCWLCTPLDGALVRPISRSAVIEPVIFPRAAATVWRSIIRAVNVLHPHSLSHLLSLHKGWVNLKSAYVGIFSSYSLKSVAVCFPVHYSTSHKVAFIPNVIYGVFELRSCTNCAISMIVAAWWICSHCMFLFSG